jgi:uncharacterized protein YecA (UPF0149 family)
MRKIKDILSLQCILTEKELLTYSKQLSENISKKARSEDCLKQFSSQVKSEIATCDANINSIAEKLNTGKEFRNVDCEIVYDFEKKERRWVRVDTFETIKTDMILEEDLQEGIKI